MAYSVPVTSEPGNNGIDAKHGDHGKPHVLANVVDCSLTELNDLMFLHPFVQQGSHRFQYQRFARRDFVGYLATVNLTLLVEHTHTHNA